MNRNHSRPPRVLITDDEKDVRRMLSVVLGSEGFDPLEAEDGQKALGIIRQGLADIMLLDLEMPDLTGLEVLRELRKLDRDFPIVMVTGFGSVEAAVEAGKYGIHGFLTKPFKNEEVVLAVHMALASLECRAESLCSLEFGLPLREAMGPSAVIQEVLDQVELVAATNFTVILCGETGVGKEVIAHAIHQASPRCGGPFVAVDCGSIPPTLIESELFGHVKGAFTGADRLRVGNFEAAAGGTLFLDEINNLPLAMQAKLLRALQERRIHRVGSATPLQLDVRILAATNEDLSALVAAGRFRRDLFYRLNEFTIQVPSLRQRGQDVLFLAERFLEWTSVELKKDVHEITTLGKEMLLAYPWPGNVRELRNVIRRAVLLARTHVGPEQLGMAGVALPEEEPPPGPWAKLLSSQKSFKDIVRQSISQAEHQILVQTLKQTGGNMKKAALILHLDYKTLRTKAKQYHIPPLTD